MPFGRLLECPIFRLRFCFLSNVGDNPPKQATDSGIHSLADYGLGGSKKLADYGLRGPKILADYGLKGQNVKKLRMQGS